MEEIPLSSWGWWSIPLFTGFYILYIPGGCSGVLNHQQYHFMYCVFGKFTSTCSASTWHRPWLLWATFKMKLEQSKSKRRHQIRNTIYTYIFMFKIEINKKKMKFLQDTFPRSLWCHKLHLPVLSCLGCCAPCRRAYRGWRKSNHPCCLQTIRKDASISVFHLQTIQISKHHVISIQKHLSHLGNLLPQTSFNPPARLWVSGPSGRVVAGVCSSRFTPAA